MSDYKEKVENFHELAKKTNILLSVFVNGVDCIKEFLCCYQDPDGTPRPSRNDDEVVAWNIPKKMYEKYEIGQVNGWTRWTKQVNDDEMTNHPEGAELWMTKMRNCIDPILQDESTTITENELIDLYCTNTNEAPYGLELLHFFNFEFTTNELKMIQNRHPDVKPEWMDRVREIYMNKIRARRAEAFVELDQLEQEVKDNTSSTQEDLEDIDTIKQMFRDIPQETDLSQYKNITDLLQFWPSLLLPNNMHKVIWEPHLSILNQPPEMDENDYLTPREAHYVEVLGSVHDIKILKNMLTEFANDPNIDPQLMVLITKRIDFLLSLPK